MKTKGTLILILAIGLCRAADVRQIRERIESVLAENDESHIAKVTESLASDEVAETTAAATAEEIAALLPVAKKSILSSRPKARSAGLLLMFTVAMRPDSARLLEPYIDDLGALLKEPDQPTRNATIFLLAGTRPVPPPKALLYLAAHMNDRNTPVDDIAPSAGGLLSPYRPVDPAILHSVLNVVRERGDAKLTARILDQMGLLQISHEEALKFIQTSLTDANSFVRRAAVQAVGKMSSDVKAKFVQDLERVVQNSDENPETRSHAKQVLDQ
jgi:hypothetical protein